MSGRNSFNELTNTISAERRAYIEERKIELREEMALAELRQAMGVSQAALAKQLEVLQAAIAKLASLFPCEHDAHMIFVSSNLPWIPFHDIVLYQKCAAKCDQD